MPDEVVNEQGPCHIRDDVNPNEIDSIRENICSGLPTTKHEAHRYCVFHLPTRDKSADFASAFERKLKSVEAALLEIEAHGLPADETVRAKEKISYDFRYLYFPSVVELGRYVFLAKTYFTRAIFTERVEFVHAKFIEMTKFEEAVFQDAYFWNATFFQEVTFVGATFNRTINCTQATFMHDAFFGDATFAGLCDFSGATFAQGAYFRSARFLDSSEVFFLSDQSKPTIRFCGEVDFQYAILAGFVDFRGKEGEDVFLDETAVLSVHSQLKETLYKGRFSALAINFPQTKAVLELSNVRLKNAGRVTFERVRLRPSWFINTDARKFIFTSVNWDNLTGALVKSYIAAELDSLKHRNITTEAAKLLEVSCRQLSANADDDSRYSEASSFRRVAMELEWQTKTRALRSLTKLWSSEKRAGTFFRILRSGSELAMHGLYRFTSYYGESWVQAAVVLLLLVLAIFPFAYRRTTFLVCPVSKGSSSQNSGSCEERRLSLSEGIRHSLAIATLQNTDFRKPYSPASETFTMFERIFGPIQAALLALAIRRRFMR